MDPMGYNGTRLRAEAKLQTLGVHPTETLKAALPRHELIFDR